MNQPKAFGSYMKRGEHTYRISAYIQWGESTKSIGACLLLNPGSAKLDDDLLHILEKEGKGNGILKTADPTMKQLIKLVEGIYGTAAPINGRFTIYNLFHIQNTENIDAIDQFENLVDSGEYSITSSLIPLTEIKSHPWMLLGWGVERKSRWKNLERIKESWRALISEANIPTIGKEHPQTDDYYHPLYSLFQPSMLQELVTNYQQKCGKQRFPVYATKPNLLVDHHPVDPLDEGEYGWFKSPANPESIVKGFSHLRIKDGYRLRAYQYTDGANGNGIVWAIPADTDLPDPNECPRLEEHFLSAPKPSFAMDDFMLTIEGDKTPMSYLQASIVYHELHEFGAAWHGIGWGRDIILPLPDTDSSITSDYEWEMIEDEPDLIDPHFYYDNEGHPTIVFYTINDIGTVTLNRYVHTFNKSNYTMQVKRFCVATAGCGIIF